jgi:general secretion pathway protein J
VELLIALAMVGLITLLLFSALRTGSRAWDSVDRVAERVGALRLARDFLQQALSQARPTSLVYDGTPVSVFAGDAERLEFVTPLAERVGVPGLYVVRLTLEDAGGDGGDLILTRWLIHPEVLEGGDGIPPWEPIREESGPAGASLPTDMDAAAGAYGRTRLLEGVDNFRIEYFGSEPGVGGQTEPEWREDWLDQATLPSLVRIRLTTLGQDWPDLIVALPAQFP